ncbi:MAG: NAD-dependent epimerase/dehydratase family protein, partial [Clostridia bacterium]|nr:NAD-dependent epimerase/dehydratase family protein [Clostridia bacterium]
KYITKFFLYLNQKYQYHVKIYILIRDKGKTESIFGINNNQITMLIGNVETYKFKIRKIDYIFHCASISNTQLFETKPVDVITANTEGTMNILNLARQVNTRGVLFFSSGAIYGNTEGVAGKIREQDSFSLCPTQISNCYAESKRMGEMLCAAYAKQYQVPAKIVRISHTYGPGIDIQDGHVYSDFVKSIINRENLLIKGNGRAVRPFCYIRDALCAFLLILLYGEVGEAYNMANSKCTVSIGELAHTLVSNAFYERQLQVSFTNNEDAQQFYKDDKVREMCIVDITKLSKLGWIPKVDIVEGFRRTVESCEAENEIM